MSHSRLPKPAAKDAEKPSPHDGAPTPRAAHPILLRQAPEGSDKEEVKDAEGAKAEDEADEESAPPRVDEGRVEELAERLDEWLWRDAMSDAREATQKVRGLNGKVRDLKGRASNPRLRRQDLAQAKRDLEKAQKDLVAAKVAETKAFQKRDAAISRTRALLEVARDSGIHVRHHGRRVALSGVESWEDPNQAQKGAEVFEPNRKRWLRQFSQERGDMHDIRAALHVLATKFPGEGPQQLRVIVVMKDAGQLGDIETIIRYYQGFGQQVLLDVGGHVDDELTLSASRSTTILQMAARAGDIAEELQDATAVPIDHPDVEAAYETLLTKLRFDVAQKDRAYALINYRVSGHGTFKGRLASHPELDTGTEGFTQLWKAAKARGYTPVPTGGGIPATVLTDLGFDDQQPNLLDYFKLVGGVVKAGEDAGLEKPLRMYEYGIFRYIAKHFPKTVAIGMRSGGLDAIAFSGIPAISLDIDQDTIGAGLEAAARGGPAAASVGAVEQDFKREIYGSHGSATRAEKREEILPEGFQQVYMGKFRHGAGSTSPDANPPGDKRAIKGHWVGELDEGSLKGVDAALEVQWERNQARLAKERESPVHKAGIADLKPAEGSELESKVEPEPAVGEEPEPVVSEPTQPVVSQTQVVGGGGAGPAAKLSRGQKKALKKRRLKENA